MLFIEDMEVIGLQELVVEFNKRESTFKTLLVRLKGQHSVDREVASNFTEEGEIIEFGKPISVVEHNRLTHPHTLMEFNDRCNLVFDRDAVLLDLLGTEHLAYLSLSRRVTNLSRATAYQCDVVMSCSLEVVHCKEWHHMADV